MCVLYVHVHAVDQASSGWSIFFLLHGIDVPRIPIAKLTEQFQLKKEMT